MGVRWKGCSIMGTTETARQGERTECWDRHCLACFLAGRAVPFQTYRQNGS
jgi:hypothetical protein